MLTVLLGITIIVNMDDNAKTIKLKELKEPLEREARKQERSLHWLIRKILSNWVRKNK